MAEPIYRPQVVGQPFAHRQQYRGINAIANLVAPTLGPTGGHVASARETGMKVELLDDSATVVRRILSIGTAQDDIGAMTMRSLVWRVGQQAGDGGATAAVLARAIYNEGLKLVAAGANTVRLERGVKKATKAVLDALTAQAEPVKSEDQLAAVAATITKNKPLAAVLGELSYLLGPNAHVSTTKYVAPYLFRRYIAGAHFKAKIASMYFYSDEQRKRAVINDPVIALTDERLKEVGQVLPLLEAALKREAKSLLIIAPEVSGAALSLLVTNHTLDKEKKKLDILVAKITQVGDEYRWATADLEMLTGARLLGLKDGANTKNVKPEDLGQAQRAEYVDDGLIVVANKEGRLAVQDEVTRLRNYIATLSLDNEDRSKLVRRLGALSGGVGELKIGASSKLEREMLYQHSERAVNVLSSAQRGGVVAGGGAALVHCIKCLQELDLGDEADVDVHLGIRLVERALAAPLLQIVKNAGLDTPAVILDKVQSAGAPATYDAVEGKIVDANACGILDVADVVGTAFKMAASAAMMALTTETIVYHKKPKESMTP